MTRYKQVHLPRETALLVNDLREKHGRDVADAKIHESLSVTKGAKMERPTCKTCPYYEEWESNPDEPGWCKRYPPALPAFESQAETYREGLFPEVSWAEWCGEHPQFPAYAAEFAKARTGLSG